MRARGETEGVAANNQAAPGITHRPQQPSGEGIRVNDAWRHYIQWAQVNKSSWRDDIRRYERHLKPDLGNRPMGEIKAWEIQGIMTRLQGTITRLGNSYKPATVRQVLMLIKRLFNWSLEQELYEGVNPAARVKLKPFDNRQTRALKPEQLSRLLKYLDTWGNERAGLVIRFALYSGKRRGEILSLTWNNVDLEKGMVTFIAANTKNNRTQILPVNQECLKILYRCLEIKTCCLVFPGDTAKRYTGFDNIWKRLRVRLGIECRFHDLRHTFATYLASSGKVDIYTLQKLLGHQDITMTQRYAHLFNHALKRGVDVADSLFNQFKEGRGDDIPTQT